MPKQLPVYDPKHKAPRSRVRAARSSSGLPVYNPKSHGTKIPVYDPKRKSAPILPAKAAPKKKPGHSPLGFVGNLSKDVASAAYGTVPGLYKTGKAVALDIYTPPKPGGHNDKIFGHTRKEVLAPLAKQYAATYGPLANGQFGKFAQGVYEHPLGPALDLATIFDVGSTAAVRGGLLKAGRAKIVTRSPKHMVEGGRGPVKLDLTDTKPITRGRQTVVDTARKKLPYNAPLVGEAKQYGKKIARDAQKLGLSEFPAYRDFVKATKHLTDREWTALNIRARDIHPADWAEAVPKGSPDWKVLSDTKIQQLALNPTPRLVRAEAADRMLGVESERIMRELGQLNPEKAAARPFKTRQQVSETLGREARPIHGDPYYKPDALEPAKGANPFYGKGGGKGVVKNLGTSKENKGVLIRLGIADLKHDVGSPEFLRRVKAKVHSTIHADLLKGAVTRTAEELRATGLPKDMEFVRPPVIGTPRGVPTTLKRPGEQSMQDLIPNPGDLRDTKLTDPFGTRSETEAFIDAKGRYYLQPSRTIRAATGEFHRSSRTMHTLVERPLSVWRALVLGTRVGFLTNNVVGNHLLYTLRAAGNKGLSSYLHAVADAKGTGAVHKLLTSKDTPPGISQQFMREFFPDQLEGTFGRTQSPVRSSLVPTQVSGRTRRRAAAGSMGIVPATQAIAEGLPRRAMVESAIRSTAEFKQILRQMPKDKRSIEAAARKLATGKHGKEYQQFVSQRVNDTLGNYLDLSPTQKATFRNAIPFFAWYRAIAKATYHLAVDTPGRALALQRLAEIANDDNYRVLGKMPSYLRGVIPIGTPNGSEATVLSTGGVNPYQTLAQLQRGATTDVSELGLNPFLMALLDQYARTKNSGQPPSPVGLFSDVVKGVGTNLPPARLVFPPAPSQQYPHKDRLTEVLSQLGAPLKRVNLPTAHQRADEGR